MDYKALNARAKQLIGGNGTKCVLVNPSTDEPFYNPATNRYEDGEPERFIGVAIISSYREELVDGKVIMAGDRQIVAVLEGGEPVASLSTLEIYDKTGTVLKEIYKVISPVKIAPDANTIIAYRLQCRK
jgi:hypothetical protein